MKLHCALLLAALPFLNLASALGQDDTADCDGHPDPHFRNFHGVAFDFQSGCDTVLVKNANMEIHSRLVQLGGYSAIDQVGVRIGTTNIVIMNGGMVMLNGALWDRLDFTFGPYTLTEDPGQRVIITFPGPSSRRELQQVPGPLGPDARPTEFGIFVNTGFGGQYGGERVIDEGDARRMQTGEFSFMSFTIKAYGELFAGCNGLCGAWNDTSPGFTDRAGTAVQVDYLYPEYPVLHDGEDYGVAWRVDAAQSDSAILDTSAGNIPPPTQWAQASCVPKGTFMGGGTSRRMQFTTPCPRCNQISSIVGTLNCLYDAQVLGCGAPEVQGYIYDPNQFYGSMVPADTDLTCADIAAIVNPPTPVTAAPVSAPLTSKSSKAPKARRLAADEDNDSRILRAKSAKTSEAKSAKAKSSKAKSSKVTTAPVSAAPTATPVDPCEAMGGTCVVYCDVASDDFECLSGLCTIEIMYEDPVPVAVFNRFATGCSCKVPNP